MKFSLKQLVVHVLLGFLRFLITCKRHSGPLFERVLSPVWAVSRFFLRVVAVPVYRLVFGVRRLRSKLLRPAKNKLTYFFSNRYVIHFAVFTVAGLALWLSPSWNDLRAEGFGSTSILYSIVSQDDTETLDIVSSDFSAERKRVSYLEGGAIDPQAHVDLNYIGESYVTPVTGMSGFESADPSAPIPSREAIVTHTIAKGETLSGIASSYGLNL